MNPQMPTHQQGSYPNPLSQQPQNFNQQKQMPNTQQKGTQGQQQTHSSFRHFDPKLTFWSLEKPKHADSWADVKPQQQQIPIEEIQDELEKFKRKDLTVKRVLDEVKSANCRKLINNLADDQTKELQNSNRTLKFIIGGVLLEWRFIDRRKKERTINRVQVILQTVPSGILEAPFPKPTGGNGSGNVNGQGAQSMKQSGMMPGQQQHGNAHGQGQGPNMAQQPRNVPQPGQSHMGQSQFDPRPHPGGQGPSFGGGNAPPPPPPGGHQVPVHGSAPPPPPPPPGAGGNQAHFHSQPNVVPGAHQGSMQMKGMRPTQPYVETIPSQFKHSQKQKPKGPPGLSSDEDSNDWDTETGSSGSDSYRVRSVEGDFAYVDEGRRGRAKRSKSTKKTHRHKSQSRVRSRSISKARHEETPTHPASVLGDTAQRLPTQSRPITAAAMKAGMVTSISVEPDLVSPPHERTTKGLLESSPPPRQCLAAPLKDHGAMSVLLTTPGNTIDVTAATEIRDHAHNLGIAMVDPIEPNTSTRILGTT
jgi:hypothetical protein